MNFATSRTYKNNGENLPSYIYKLVFLTLFFPQGNQRAFAQETPPLINYSPSLYKAHNQNWSLSQSSDNIMYFANSDGLLEYDGAAWRLYPLPDQQIVRTVLCDDYIVPGKKSGTTKIEKRIYPKNLIRF